MTARMRIGWLSLVFVVACGGPDITLTDDIDLTWDFGFTLARFGDTLHSPYVRGAPMVLSVYAKDDSQTFDGWSVETSDPSVFQISSVSAAGKTFTASAMAVGEGSAELTVIDDHGQVIGSADADVLQPDHVGLDAHGYLIMGMDDQASVDEVRVLDGGSATFVVNYFKGNTELHGNRVLTIDPTPGLTGEARESFLFENREWLTVTADGAEGSLSLPLRSDGDLVGSMPVTVVAETDIDDVVLWTQSEADHKDGDWLVAYAQAYDTAQRRIFGVDYAWNVDGIDQTGDGDLYRYQYASGPSQAVTASRGARSATNFIHSEGGFVDSTNNVGCSAGGSTGILGGLVVFGLAGSLRRRRWRRR
jgi:uncharacterized protein (TIGR03382 family)